MREAWSPRLPRDDPDGEDDGDARDDGAVSFGPPAPPGRRNENGDQQGQDDETNVGGLRLALGAIPGRVNQDELNGAIHPDMIVALLVVVPCLPRRGTNAKREVEDVSCANVEIGAMDSISAAGERGDRIDTGGGGDGLDAGRHVGGTRWVPVVEPPDQRSIAVEPGVKLDGEPMGGGRARGGVALDPQEGIGAHRGVGGFGSVGIGDPRFAIDHELVLVGARRREGDGGAPFVGRASHRGERHGPSR